MRGRILVADWQIPKPDQDSGSLGTFELLDVLARGGFSVSFVPADLEPVGGYADLLKNMGVATLTKPGWNSFEQVIEAMTPRHDVLLLHRAPIAGMVFDLARRVAPRTKILFHTVDLHYLRMERQAALTGDAGKMRDAALMRDLELDLVRRSDASIVVSEHERAVLGEVTPGAVVHHVPVMIRTPSVETGSRLTHSIRRLAGRPWGRRKDIVFLACFAHEPNADAVHWFVREVWPRLLAKGYRDRFVIVGSNIPPHIDALASAQIEPRGYVPALTPMFAECRLSIAPLRFGAGIKGKVLNSLAHRVPVVASSMATEGMGLRHGTDVLVADDPEAMAGAIMRAYTSAPLWSRLSEGGFAAFRRLFSTEEIGDHLLQVVDSLIERKPARPAAEARGAFALGLLGLLALDPFVDADFEHRKGHGAFQQHRIVELAHVEA
jgi:glycosyltransferase involved in cell wall biosynthesis